MKKVLCGLLVLLVLASFLIVFIPVYLIRPFVPQTAADVEVSYTLRSLSPILTLAALVLGLLCAYALWKSTASRLRRTSLAVAGVLLTALAILARQNHFEWMFRPLSQPGYVEGAKASHVKDGDMVLSLELGGEARAYPVPLMAYHHLVNTTVGGEPIVATYWTLCHTGLVWKSTVDGRVLHFRLFGINNQNFIMRDEETGSWWQQISGKAIQGPLKGKQLQGVAFDEMSFALWKQERPKGQVLLADAGTQKKYAKPDWELRMLSNPTVTAVDPKDLLKPRSLVIGVRIEGVSKAYPMQQVLLENPIVDTLASKPILVVAGPDGRSVRAFERTAGERALDLYLEPGSNPFSLVDTQTGSQWDFSGKAVQGPLAGTQLPRIQALKDYWFDWKLYNPQTLVYQAGKMAR